MTALFVGTLAGAEGKGTGRDGAIDGDNLGMLRQAKELTDAISRGVTVGDEASHGGMHTVGPGGLPPGLGGLVAFSKLKALIGQV